MRYVEVLRPPAWTYGVLAGLVALFSFTFAAVITVPYALGVFAALMALGVLGINRRSLRLAVDDQRLSVGGDDVALADIRGAEALDVDAMSRIAGPDADSRAHLVLRNLATKTGVRIDLGGGPVPYWLVSSKHPEELVDAVCGR